MLEPMLFLETIQVLAFTRSMARRNRNVNKSNNGDGFKLSNERNNCNKNNDISNNENLNIVNQNDNVKVYHKLGTIILRNVPKIKYLINRIDSHSRLIVYHKRKQFIKIDVSHQTINEELSLAVILSELAKDADSFGIIKMYIQLNDVIFNYITADKLIKIGNWKIVHNISKTIGSHHG